MRNVTSFGIASLLILAAAVCLAQKPELAVQMGHSTLVTSVMFSPDGRILASGGLDSTVKLWDVSNGVELRVLKHSFAILSVAFSPSGKTLAGAAGDKTIKLWDVASGMELRTIRLSAVVSSLAFSPDCTSLASSGDDSVIRLWDVNTGLQLRTLTGHAGQVFSVAFSPDGKTIASGSDDHTLKIWNTIDGTTLRTFNGHSDAVISVAFSPDGKTIASGSRDKTVKLWNAESGMELSNFVGSSDLVRSVAFSSDGKSLASGGLDQMIRLWGVTDHRVRTFNCDTPIFSLAVSPNRLTIAAAGSNGKIILWDADTGHVVATLQPHSYWVSSVALSPNNQMVASGNLDNTIKMWNLTQPGELVTYSGGPHLPMLGITSVTFSPDGKVLAGGSANGSVILWDVADGQRVRTLIGGSGPVSSIAFSPDGQSLVSGTAVGTIIQWDLTTGTELRKFVGHSAWIRSVAFSRDGNILVSGSDDRTIKLWKVANATELKTLSGYSDAVWSVAFSPDCKSLAASSLDNTIKLWDVDSGTELHTLFGHSAGALSVAFSPDGSLLASGSWDKTIRLWSLPSGKEIRTLKGNSGVNAVAFSADGNMLVSGGTESYLELWRVADGAPLATLIAVDQKDWVVTDPSGRFDASPPALRLISWRVGAGLYDTVGLGQLKERYYDPGLLQKILGLSKEPLRDVRSFENPKLNPDIDFKPVGKGSSALVVTLTNRGGGIGRIQVFVNGKEFLADARDEKLKRDPNVAQAILTVDPSKSPSAIPGAQNDVRIVAWNVENYISSRGTQLALSLGGPTDRAPPEVYAIVGGISNYAGSQLNLNFAAKDAVDIANAIELGAKRLFGADKVHLTLLTTAEDFRAVAPTKDNFLRAFNAARGAKPTDILIVYLAGHGITLQRGSDTYCYLTQEARTTDTAALSDSEVRKHESITSDELVDWIKQIPANKQVVMLDTCAAGAAQAQLRLVDKREASGDAIRAIDRAKDRTGSYILMGSAADAVSYEASQYGQGLLTYALLKGLKGAALNNDEFVDVSKLFQYARDEVELLAKNIGGVQRPIIFAPKDDSFEVGQLKTEDREKITLASPKPIILRPRFLDAQTDDDTIDLMKALRARLRDESFIIVRGSNQSALVFVDDEDFPGGIRPTGRYTIEGNKVTVTLHLRRDGVEIGSPQIIIGNKSDVQALSAKVLDAMKSFIRQ